MRNIELKARLTDRARALATCIQIGATPRGDIHQLDTYFNVPHGRLKLREATPGPCELVHYHRPDTPGPKGCDYTLHPADPTLKPLLTDALGVLTTVDKIRTLYLWQNVRIHLDTVHGLGTFIEFEAVLDDHHDDTDGQAKLNHLIQAFHLREEDHLAHSYLDLSLHA